MPTTQDGIAYRVDYTFTGKSMVHYHCPSCKVPIKKPLGEAGSLDFCDECGGRCTIPGLPEKQARAQRIIEESLAKESKDAARREQAQAARLQRAANAIGTVQRLGRVRVWSAILTLKIMCVAIAILTALSYGLAGYFYYNAARILGAVARMKTPRASEADRSEYFGNLDLGHTTLWIAFCLTGFFATLLIGYAIASAIERGLKAKAVVPTSATED